MSTLVTTAVHHLATTWVTVSASGQIDDPPNKTDIGAGVWLPIVVFALIGATILLWRNMKKQIGRIDFEEKTPSQPAQPSQPSGPSEDGA